MVIIVEKILWYSVSLLECVEAVYPATKIIFHTSTPERRHFSLLCVLYVLAMRDETKKPRKIIIQLRKKKTGVRNSGHYVCS